MGPAAPKPALQTETIRQFDSLEVRAGLFRLNLAAFRTSEYAVLTGTAEPPPAIMAARFELKAYASPN